MSNIKQRHIRRINIWRALGLALLALAGAPAWVRAGDAPYGSKAEQTTQVQVAVLVDLIKPKADVKVEEQPVVFVSLENKDPDADFLQLLAKNGINAKAGSKGKWVNGQVVDPGTGKSSVIYHVRGLKWVSETQVKAEGAKVYANLGAEGSDYVINWDGEKWKVATAKATWVA